MEWIWRSELLHVSAVVLVLSELDWKRLWFKPVVVLVETVLLGTALSLLFEWVIPVGIRPLVPPLTLAFLWIFYRRPEDRGQYQMSRWERMFSRIGTLVSMGWQIGSLLLADNPSSPILNEKKGPTEPPRPPEGMMGVMAPLLGELLNSPLFKDLPGAEGERGSTASMRRRPVYSE